MWSAGTLHGLINSVVIAGIAAVLAVILGAAAAYPLARLSFWARRPLLYSLLGSQSIPGIALLLPLYIMLAGIQGILGAPPDRLLPGDHRRLHDVRAAAGHGGLLRVPARHAEGPGGRRPGDGCTRLGALRRVVVPLMAPALVVSGVFAFLVGWNDVLFASALTNSGTQTVAITLQQFGLGQSETIGAQPLYGDLMAAALVSAIPVVVLYLAFQRYLVQGLAAGALDGT